jgi:hypothetical protein
MLYAGINADAWSRELLAAPGVSSVYPFLGAQRYQAVRLIFRAPIKRTKAAMKI